MTHQAFLQDVSLSPSVENPLSPSVENPLSPSAENPLSPSAENPLSPSEKHRVRIDDVLYEILRSCFKKEHRSRFEDVLYEILRSCFKKEHRSRFEEVLQDLLLVTRCHSCGIEYKVSFFGYVGQHCERRCWDAYGDGGYEGHDQETCKWCNDCPDQPPVSKANSLRHMLYYRSRHEMRHIWPMKRRSDIIPCDNECIQTRPTICIRGYNDGHKPRP